jgi:hypothetical protein
MADQVSLTVKRKDYYTDRCLAVAYRIQRRYQEWSRCENESFTGKSNAFIYPAQ